MENQTKSIVTCAVCGYPTELESCEFNERGQPIHPDCAVPLLRKKWGRFVEWRKSRALASEMQSEKSNPASRPASLRCLSGKASK